MSGDRGHMPGWLMSPVPGPRSIGTALCVRLCEVTGVVGAKWELRVPEPQNIGSGTDFRFTYLVTTSPRVTCVRFPSWTPLGNCEHRPCARPVSL